MILLKALFRPITATRLNNLFIKPQRHDLLSIMNINVGNNRKHYSTELKNEQENNTSTSLSSIDITPLKLATDLYAVFRIHNRPYLVTEGDKVILPFKMKQAEVGDILRLTDVITLGSRNFTLKDNPIDPSLYNLKATVIEKTKRKFEIREVTKRRNRRVRHAKRKGDLTILRISKLEVV